MYPNLVPQETVVLREGKYSSQSVERLVVGDIVEVKFGDRVPADIRVLQASGFKVSGAELYSVPTSNVAGNRTSLIPTLPRLWKEFWIKSQLKLNPSKNTHYYHTSVY